METTAHSETTTPAGLEKAAILLLTLGTDASAGVLRHLSESEVRTLSSAMTQVRSIPRARAAEVHEEAWRWLTSREGFLVDGEGVARQLIASVAATRSGRAQQTMRELARAGAPRETLGQRLASVAPPVLAQLLAPEHPQVAAFILAQLQPRQAALVLAELPEDRHGDLVRRIAELTSVAPETLEDVGQVLEAQIGRLGHTALGAEFGGAKLAAEIMNLVDRGVEARVLSELDVRVPAVADTIRRLMLTFEDLLQLDDRDLQTVLKDVSRDDLTLAMRTATPALYDKIMRNLSQRAAAILQEELSTMGPARLRDVEAAQQNVVAAARRLADEDRVHLGGSEDPRV